MSILQKLYFLANPDLSFYAKNSLNENEEKVLRDFVWMYQEEIKDPSAGVIGVSKKFSEFVCNEYPEQTVDQIDGFFILDNPFLFQSNFESVEIEQMKTAGLNPEQDLDRKNFYASLDPMRRQDFFIMPHVWNTLNDKLIDLTGYFKYVKTGHSSDNQPRRYLPTE